MTVLSAHFSIEEFADELTGEVKLGDGFIDHLEKLRVAYARPMIVTSGCRSGDHNDWLIRRGLPASPNSFHLIENEKYQTGGCIALDVARPNGINLHHMIRCATDLRWSVGIARTFVHLDLRATYTSLKPNVYTY